MTYETQFVDLQSQHTAVVRGHVTTDEMKDFLGRAFGEVIGALEEQGLHVSGAPFGRYTPTEDGAFDVEAGFPCSGVVRPTGRVEASELPGGRVARTLHKGAYDGVGAAYQAALDWLTEEGHVTTGTPWESYLDGPDVPEPRTEVFLPCTAAHPAHPVVT